jgi:hypothetical protein
MMLPVAVCAPVVNERIVPAAEGYVTSRPMARVIARRVPERAALVLFDEPPPSLRFLVRHNFVRADWYASVLDAPRAADGYVYLAVQPSREAAVRALVDGQSRGRASFDVLGRTPGLVLARVRA